MLPARAHTQQQQGPWAVLRCGLTQPLLRKTRHISKIVFARELRSCITKQLYASKRSHFLTSAGAGTGTSVGTGIGTGPTGACLPCWTVAKLL